MKRIKVLGSVLKRTRADKIIIGFIVFIFAIAAVIQLVEPDINRFPCFFALDNRLQQAVRRCVCEWDGLCLSV